MEPYERTDVTTLFDDDENVIAMVTPDLDTEVHEDLANAWKRSRTVGGLGTLFQMLPEGAARDQVQKLLNFLKDEEQ